MAPMAVQWDGALALLSPIASPPPSNSSRRTASSSCHSLRPSFNRHLQQRVGRTMSKTGFGSGMKESKNFDARMLFKTSAGDWRSIFLEDELETTVSSEAHKVSVPENPSSENLFPISDTLVDTKDGVEGQVDSFDEKISKPLNGASTSHVEAQVDDIEHQQLEKLSLESNGAVEAQVDDVEEQKPELLNQVEASDAYEEQKLDSTVGGSESQSSWTMEASDVVEEQRLDSSVGGSEGPSSSQMIKCKQVLTLFKERKIEEAIGLLSSISELDEWVVSSYAELLQDFAKGKDVAKCKELHALASKRGFVANMVIASNLISAYGKLGMVPEAQRIFDSMHTRSAMSWNALISAYAKHGDHKAAVKLYTDMKAEGFQPETVTFILMLNSCSSKGDIELGRQIHADIKKYDSEGKVWVSSALLNMYVKCGTLEEARSVFDNLPTKTVVSWTSMMSGYAKSGNGREALNLYQQMRRAGSKPTYITFIFLLKACASLGELEQGIQIHAEIMRNGIGMNTYLGTALIDMYSKCRCIEKAQMVFDRIPSPNAVTYATLISGLCKNSKNKEAVRFFMEMKNRGFKPNAMTTASVLHACGIAGLLEEGIQIHKYTVENEWASNVHVAAGLIDMYSRCGKLQLARELFDNVKEHSVVSWTSMIAAYARNAAGEESFKLFDQMKKQGVKPDGMTFVFVLLACAATTNLEMGKQTHAEILEAGLESHIAVGSALVDMYSKCGSLEDSRIVFDRMPNKNVTTWTSMIAALVKHENAEEAFQLYRKMKFAGLKPDAWVFACILNACVQLRSLQYGEEVHEDIKKSKYVNDPAVAKALSIMYFKCRNPATEQAQAVSFDNA